MRFTPFPKVTADQLRITPQRLTAAKRALQREKRRAGMFVDELGPKETPEERIARQDAAFVAHWKRMRDAQAQRWREGRRLLFSLPPEQRHQLRDEWRTCGWPGTPEYFLTWLQRKLNVRQPQEISSDELQRALFAKDLQQEPEVVDGQLTLF